MKFDQHYMIDEKLLLLIASYCNNSCIEIGPGHGALTKHLLKKGQVTAIEIDSENIAYLQEKFEKEIAKSKLTLINDSALEHPLTGRLLFSNLPYAISEPIMYKILRSGIEVAYLVTGKRFLEILQSDSKIGLLMQSNFHITNLKNIGCEAFNPQPRVESCFFVMKRRASSFVGTILQQYDKKVKNAIIQGIRETGKTNKDSKEIFTKLSLPKTITDKRIMHLSNLQCKMVVERLNTL